VGVKFGDDDLLAAVCHAGRTADPDGVRRALAALLHGDVDAACLESRLRRLRAAGLVRAVYTDAASLPLFHLTQAGLDRLEALESEPPSPAVD
jgi:hypothetical protein